MTDAKCYVGQWRHRPDGVPRASECDYIHPLDFGPIVDALYHDVWSNNTFFVDKFPAERVIVCSDHGRAPLSSHSDYEQWKDEFLPGELWALWGEDWVPYETAGGTNEPYLANPQVATDAVRPTVPRAGSRQAELGAGGI